MNKYNHWYNSITENAKSRNIDGYTESHHILPLSLGGPDTPENLVELTAREHFICHWLLVKMYPTGEEHWKMLNALRIMRAESPRHKRYKTNITARVYENLKEEYSRLQSEKYRGKNNSFYGKKHTEEAKEKIRQANTGRIQPPDEKERQIKAITGRKVKFTAEWRENLSKSRTGEKNHRYGVEVSEETRKKIGDKMRGRKQTEEEKRQRGLANIGKKKERQTCPHCNKNVAVNIYARYHGNRCKNLDKSA